MVWVKIDDRAMQHPKLQLAGVDGVVLWLAGLCHANGFRTEGRIVKALVPGLYAGLTPHRAQRAAVHLVALGLWDDDNDEHYTVHDYALYQAQAMPELAEASRLAARERKARQRERSRRDTGVTDGVTDAGVTDHVTHANGAVAKDVSRRDLAHARVPDPDPDPDQQKDLHPARASLLSVPDAPAANDNGAPRARFGRTLPPEGTTNYAHAAVREFQKLLPNIASHDFRTWADDWQWIGARPAKERAAVIATLVRSAWATREWQGCHPGHIRKHWHAYAAGKEPGRQQREDARHAGPSQVATVDEYEAERALWDDPASSQPAAPGQPPPTDTTTKG